LIFEQQAYERRHYKLKPLQFFKSLLFIVIYSATYGQTPELDSLRVQADKNPKIRMFKCAQCEAFAKYAMVDSAKICLTESRAKKNSSAEIEISWLLTEAIIDQVTADENAAAIHYDSVFSIISSEQPAFRITQKAYLQAFHFYRYYSLCGTGVNRTAEFVELC